MTTLLEVTHYELDYRNEEGNAVSEKFTNATEAVERFEHICNTVLPKTKAYVSLWKMGKDNRLDQSCTEMLSAYCHDNRVIYS